MQKLMQKYATLLVSKGVNIQKGQRLIINSSVENAPFARLCVQAAYQLGAKEVIVRWSDDFVARQTYLNGDDSLFDTMHSWDIDFFESVSSEGAAWLAIVGSDPEALKGVDPARLRRANISRGKSTENFRARQMSGFVPWSIGAVPSVAWAKKVFPGMSESDAVNALWKAIFNAVRVNESDDPVALWDEHLRKMQQRRDKLNSLKIAKLFYKNSLGTDLEIAMPDGVRWDGGSELSSNEYKVAYCPNMPTEEIFTAPHKNGANGTVVASMPLVVGGNIVDNFSFTLKDGKIIDAKAERGLEFLQSALDTDEGGRYLGEVALVPVNSPIAEGGVLFFNTLFDENASCHLAFGRAYPCIEGAEDMTAEQLVQAGLNQSITHNDFMIGTSDLEITALTRSGEKVMIMRGGRFVI